MPVHDLSLNESPYPPTELIQQALREAAARVARYPAAEQTGILKRVAAVLGLEPDRVMVTRSIDEAVDRLADRYRGRRFLLFSPTFLSYLLRLEKREVRFETVPLGPDFELGVEQLARVDREDVVLLPNPNNPSANLFPGAVVAELAGRCHRLLVDEAYIDYSRHSSFLRDPAWEGHYVFRSFSKAYGLAGLRLGVLCGPAEAIAELSAKQWFCNLDTLNHAVLEAVLGHPFADEVAHRVVQDRESLRAGLVKLGFHVYESHTNFLLVKSDRPEEIIEFLLLNGIRIRDTSAYGLDGHLRISVGTPRVNARLLELMGEYSQS